jgi:hypothetical protein
MSDDIVTRLRREAVEEGFSNTDWTQLSFDVQNACDEIERLRIDLDYWYERCRETEVCANIMHNKLNKKWWKR